MTTPEPGTDTTEDPLEHELLFDSDGDGWTEPFSESWTCNCGQSIDDWVQRDPEQSGRPDLLDVLHAHALHVAASVAQPADPAEDRIHRMLHYCDQELARRKDDIGCDPRHETGVVPIRVIRTILAGGAS